MATSNSFDFNQTRTEIITDALVLTNVLEAGETPSAEDDAYAARQLNRMIKTWMVDGIHLWTRQEAYLFVQKSQARYQIGNGAKAALVSDAVRTELSANASSGDSTIPVDSVSGIAASDNIGVVLDDDTIEWFTVSSISGTDITLSGSLGGNAATDNQVFAYTSDINRPLRVIDAQRTSAEDVDTPIITVSHEEYQRLPNKTDTGKTNELYYQPLRDTGIVNLWPEPETAADRIRMTALLPIEDMDSNPNNPDFPQEWLDALVWGLAARLAPSYGVPRQRYQEIKAEAESLYSGILMWDQEPESVYFQPALTSSFGD